MSQKRASQPNTSTQPVLPRLATRSASTSGPSGNSGPSTPVPASWVSLRPADPAKSLYNVCAVILTRMSGVPALLPYIQACDYTTGDTTMPKINLGVAPHGGHIDPVSQLWRVLRLGVPLCVLFNALETSTTLETLPPDQCVEVRVVKRFLYRFLEACMTELSFRPEEELFTISNVFSDSTSDFLKVLKTVQALLDLIETKSKLVPNGQVAQSDVPAAKSQRDNVVLELLQTERKYVQDLELLSQYHDALLAANLPRENVQKMFPYLSRLVDFQRRFLVGLEYHARLPADEQQFGSLFALMKDEFQVYEGYTLNQKEASDLALVEVPALLPFSDILEPNHELQAMLIKPVQRICKYPLLLKQIIKYTPREWPHYPALMTGLDIMQDITQTVNETQRRVENRYVFSDLRERLKDWRGLALERMGDLLLSGVFPVVTLDNEMEYHLYLFETILLCCKDGIPAKKGGPLKMRTRQSKRFSLDLKGRIYMSFVTATQVTKESNGYLLSVLWGKGDAAETGSFDIRLGNEEQANLWETTIQKLIVARHGDSGLTTAYEDEDVVGGFYDEPNTPTSITATSPLDGSRGLRKLSISSFRASTDGSSRLSQQTHIGEEANRSSGSGIAGRSWSTASNSTTTLVSPPAMIHAHSESMIGTLQSQDPNRTSYSTAGTTLNGNNSMGNLNNGLRKLSVSTMSTTAESSHYKLEGLPPLSTGSSVDFHIGGGPYSAHPLTGSAPAVPPVPVEDADKHRVRVHHRVDSFLLIVPKGITYVQLQTRVERKIRLCGKLVPDPMRIKYRDEDDDFVTLGSDDDLQMALEERTNQELTLWVT